MVTSNGSNVWSVDMTVKLFLFKPGREISTFPLSSWVVSAHGWIAPSSHSIEKLDSHCTTFGANTITDVFNDEAF